MIKKKNKNLKKNNIVNFCVLKKKDFFPISFIRKKNIKKYSLYLDNFFYNKILLNNYDKKNYLSLKGYYKKPSKKRLRFRSLAFKYNLIYTNYLIKFYNINGFYLKNLNHKKVIKNKKFMLYFYDFLKLKLKKKLLYFLNFKIKKNKTKRILFFRFLFLLKINNFLLKKKLFIFNKNKNFKYSSKDFYKYKHILNLKDKIKKKGSFFLCLKNKENVYFFKIKKKKYLCKEKKPFLNILSILYFLLFYIYDYRYLLFLKFLLKKLMLKEIYFFNKDFQFFFLLNRKLNALFLLNFIKVWANKNKGRYKKNISSLLYEIVDVLKKKKKKLLGFKMLISGRFSKGERSKYIVNKDKNISNSISYSTIRIPIDFAKGALVSKYGIYGIKIWLSYMNFE